MAAEAEAAREARAKVILSMKMSGNYKTFTKYEQKLQVDKTLILNFLVIILILVGKALFSIMNKGQLRLERNSRG